MVGAEGRVRTLAYDETQAAAGEFDAPVWAMQKGLKVSGYVGVGLTFGFLHRGSTIVDRFTALRVFTGVVQQGGFSAAARALGLSNAAVSKNVAELETHLGVQLIARSTRRMRLTEAGELYYRDVARLLEQLRDADASVSALAQSPRGALRVTAPMSFGLAKLTKLVPLFLQRYPDIALDLVLDDTVLDLVALRYDVGIRGSGTLSDSSLRARKLADLDRVLCAAPSYVNCRSHASLNQPADLMGHCCIVYTLGHESEFWRFARTGAPSDLDADLVTVRINGPYRVNNSLAIRDALLAGAGLSIIPRLYVEDDLQTGRLVELLPGWRAPSQSIFAIFDSTRFLPRPTRAFIDFVVESLTAPGTTMAGSGAQ